MKSQTWQQMHDGLFWPRYAPLLPGHLDFADPVCAIEDYNSINERLRVLRERLE